MKRKNVKLLSALLVAGLIFVQPLSALASEDTNTDDVSSGTVSDDNDAPEDNLSASQTTAISEAYSSSSEISSLSENVDSSDNDGTSEDGIDLSSGTWEGSGNQRRYKLSDGSYLPKGLYWLPNEKGEEKLYAFNESCFIITGWYLNTWTDNDTGESGSDWFYFDSNGAGYTGWVSSGGKWYYCDNGYMFKDTMYWTDDTANAKSYAFDESGAMVTGWYLDSGTDVETGETYSNWFYFDSNGAGHNGWLYSGKKWYYCKTGYMLNNTPVEDKGKTYFLSPSGAMVTGWYLDSGTDDEGNSYSDWYYYKSSGEMVKGWIKLKGIWYYLDPEYGWMYSNDQGNTEIGGKVYRFTSSGAMVTGWYKDSGTDDEGNSYSDWYYYKSSGEMVKGWVKLKGIWYYLDPEYGWMYSNDQGNTEIGGKVYRFASSGAMVTGWYKDSGTDDEGNAYSDWYYYKSSGEMVKGWIKLNGIWYYLDRDWGQMYCLCPAQIDSNLYLFSASGAMYSKPGWTKLTFEYDGDTYYDWFYVSKSSGELRTGWITSGGKTYYLDPEYGYMYYDIDAEIDGKTYSFDESGVCLGEYSNN